MASKSKLLAIAGRGNGKQVLTLIQSCVISRKEVHTSAYDKNTDKAIVQPPVIPDYVIGTQSKTYWGPHPRTGVFGPNGPNTEPNMTSGAHEPVSGQSVLDEKVRFRPLEDIDKPADA